MHTHMVKLKCLLSCDMKVSYIALFPGFPALFGWKGVYQLFFVLIQCDHTTSLRALFKQINAEPVKIAWIGSGCSVATEPIAETSHFFNITHVSVWDGMAETSSDLHP